MQETYIAKDGCVYNSGVKIAECFDLSVIKNGNAFVRSKEEVARFLVKMLTHVVSTKNKAQLKDDALEQAVGRCFDVTQDIPEEVRKSVLSAYDI